MLKTKKMALALLGLLLPLFLLTACGTPNIQGKWKAQTIGGENQTIEFKEKKVVIDGEEYDYEQHATGFKNNVKYVGLKIEEDNASIIFPDPDQNIAILLLVESTDDYLKGTMVAALNRKDNPDYQKYAEKYMMQK